MSDQMSSENGSTHGDTETRIREIWSDVLQVKQIGVHDDFYDLGGDSLAAMLCISRMRTQFGVEFFVEDFFIVGASISHFAGVLRSADSERTRSGTGR
jgi:hypothetical protein